MVNQCQCLHIARIFWCRHFIVIAAVSVYAYAFLHLLGIKCVDEKYLWSPAVRSHLNNTDILHTHKNAGVMTTVIYASVSLSVCWRNGRSGRSSSHGVHWPQPDHCSKQSARHMWRVDFVTSRLIVVRFAGIKRKSLCGELLPESRQNACHWLAGDVCRLFYPCSSIASLCT